MRLNDTTTRQLSNPRGRCGPHVAHDLIAGDQPLREMTAQTACILDRPPAISELGSPTQQLAIAGQRRINPKRRQWRVRGRVHRCRSVGTLVRVNTNDHVRAPFRFALLGEPRSAADFWVQDRNRTSVGPDHDGSPAGRQTPGEPTRRRQAIHEPTRPATYQTPRASTRNDRPLTYKSAIQTVYTFIVEDRQTLALGDSAVGQSHSCAAVNVATAHGNPPPRTVAMAS